MLPTVKIKQQKADKGNVLIYARAVSAKRHKKQVMRLPPREGA